MRTMLAVMTIVIAMAAGAAARAAELLMFEEAGCVWCQRWHAEIGPGYPMTVEGRAAPLRRVDLRAGPPGNVKLTRPVTSTPTFVLVEGGEERDRLVGYPGAEFFYPLLARMLARLDARGERQALLRAAAQAYPTPPRGD